jgi:lipopolysaccharide export system protein LptC
MGERVSSWFAVLLLFVVLVTSYWYAQTLRLASISDAGRVGEIDFFAEGVALTGFDAVGRPRYRLFSDRMTHFGVSDDIDLVKPRLLSMRPDQPQVQATARSAHAQNNAQTVHMQGDVVITRAADGPHAAMRLETESLIAVPDDDHFWTDAPVRLLSGNSVMSGKGMDFDNIARRVELHGAVTGSFPPRSRQ